MKKEKATPPLSLVELANQVDKKRRLEAAEIKNQSLIEERRRAREKAERIKNGLKYAKKIFQWAEEFAGTSEGRRLIEIGMKYNYREGIYFFDEKIPGEAWRGLGISKKGLWWIYNGCCARERYVETPEELASEIEPVILQKAVETLETGQVWECIKTRMSE